LFENLCTPGLLYTLELLCHFGILESKVDRTSSALTIISI